MKPRLQTSLGQQLVLTPQLRQALHLLQLSALELETEITTAVESNPLLDWEEDEPLRIDNGDDRDAMRGERDAAQGAGESGEKHDRDEPWESDNDPWRESSGGHWSGDDDGDATDRIVKTDTLQEHLAWQLHLSPLSPRDLRIGLMLVDAIDDDGYLREPMETILEGLLPETPCTAKEVGAVLHQIQRFDPVGVGARNLEECLSLQLAVLSDDTPGKALAQRFVSTLIDRLPRIGIEGLAGELACAAEDAATALQLLRSLDPHPGAQMGGIPTDTYITPDCVITRQNGMWRAALVNEHQTRLTIHRGYEQMIRHAGASDAGYLRGRPGTVARVFEGNYAYFCSTGEDGLGEPVPVYVVRFEPADIWGSRAEPNPGPVFAEIYQTYLSPSPAPAQEGDR